MALFPYGALNGTHAYNRLLKGYELSKKGSNRQSRFEIDGRVSSILRRKFGATGKLVEVRSRMERGKKVFDRIKKAGSYALYL